MKTSKFLRHFHGVLAVATITFGLALCARAQTETVLYNFPGNWTGAQPESGLTMDLAGNLYGTTWWGGGNPTVCNDSTSSCGTVYQLSPGAGGTWTQTVLHRFTGDSHGGRL